MSEKHITTRKKWIFSRKILLLSSGSVWRWHPWPCKNRFFLTIPGRNSARISTPTGRTYGVPVCCHDYSPFLDQIREDMVSSCSNEDLNRPCFISHYFYRSPLEIELKWSKMIVIGNPGSGLNRPKANLILCFFYLKQFFPKMRSFGRKRMANDGLEWNENEKPRRK